METLELPIVDEMEISPWPETPPVNFVEQEVDLKAFELWREASSLDTAADEPEAK